MENTNEINGQHLIDLGFKPAKWFRAAIAHINDGAFTISASLEQKIRAIYS